MKIDEETGLLSSLLKNYNRTAEQVFTLWEPLGKETCSMLRICRTCINQSEFSAA